MNALRNLFWGTVLLEGESFCYRWGMGRPRRLALGGYVYHVLNRANGRLRVFRKVGDFAAFEEILAEGLERHATIFISS